MLLGGHRDVHDGHTPDVRDGASSFKVRVHHANKISTLLNMMRSMMKSPSYILVEELKSVREAYMRVAVIVVDIIEGIMSIYIEGGREDEDVRSRCPP
jgi:hypothetical protein